MFESTACILDYLSKFKTITMPICSSCEKEAVFETSDARGDVVCTNCGAVLVV